ncbi:MAG: amidohydrolase family protein [Polyangiales bacterium]
MTNARILACSKDPAARPFDGDVLIEGQRIVRVTTGRMSVDRASTRVVDLRRALLMPGLGDAHTHISWPLDFVFNHGAVAAAPPAAHALDVAAVAKTYLESGYTLIVGAGVLQEQDDLLAKDAIDRGLLTGPRIVPSGLMVAEQGGLGDAGGMMDVAANADDLRAIVARQCDAGVRAIKLFISGDGAVPAFPSDDVYMNDVMLEAAVTEASRHGAFITAHARCAESVAMAARTGVRLIHHACFLDDQALRALQARGQDVWVCPGLHYLYAMVNGHARAWGISDEHIEASGYPRELVAQVDGLKRMRSANIQIVSGGDFGHQWTRHGTYAAELQRYVELVGMTPGEAIHTATRNMGPLVGLELGQIAEGFLADMLVVEGDPTVDITVLQQSALRRAVIKGGEFVYLNPVMLSC